MVILIDSFSKLYYSKDFQGLRWETSLLSAHDHFWILKWGKWKLFYDARDFVEKKEYDINSEISRLSKVKELVCFFEFFLSLSGK